MLKCILVDKFRAPANVCVVNRQAGGFWIKTTHARELERILNNQYQAGVVGIAQPTAAAVAAAVTAAAALSAGAPCVPPRMDVHVLPARGRGRGSRGGGRSATALPAPAAVSALCSNSAEPKAGGGGAHLHFGADELMALVMLVAPEYQAGNRGNINWFFVAQKMQSPGHAARAPSALQNKFRVILKSYTAIKHDEEKGTGASRVVSTMLVVECCMPPWLLSLHNIMYIPCCACCRRWRTVVSAIR